MKSVPVFFVAAFLFAGAGMGSAAAQNSRPGEHASAGREVESQQEADWVDNRWSRTDVGAFLASNVGVPGRKIAKGLTIKVGKKDEGAVAYDTATCTWRAGWLGGFLKFSPSRFGLMEAPKIDGDVKLNVTADAGWLDTPVRYLGLYPQGKRVVLSYTAGGSRVLESPWLEGAGESKVFTRSFEFEPSVGKLQLVLANFKDGGKITPSTEVKTGGITVVEDTNALAIACRGADVSLRGEPGRILLVVPSHREKLKLKVTLWRGGTNDLPGVLNQEPRAADDLGALVTQPPAPRWLPELKTAGRRGFDTDILAVDTLTVPYDNPWKALMFLAGVDFTPDGTAYVCTIHGDVWRVTGVDETLRQLTWRRFATGLFQPLGLKVRDGKVFVLGRDRITLLHDRNNDGEADFYESFCSLIDTSTGGHDYVTSLEQDDAGNFYYVDPRGAHRISADGSRNEILATGFRYANSLGASPDGAIVTVAPQQGEWTPSSLIAQIKPGDYYGYGGPKVTPERPLGYDAPLCWIPHNVDNSSGSQVWVPKDRWGPLGGQMLHLLWGRCGMMLVLRDQVGGIAQGAVVPLPGRFLSGPNRGTFNPIDGHLYVAGSTGWQTSAAKDGALQRVRFTGRPVHLPIAWHAHSNGLSLTFTRPLDRAAAEDAGSYGIRQWNYRYARQYGSDDWSVAQPDQRGRDEVVVKSARLLPDGRTVFLEIPSLKPVMQIEIKYSLNSAEGTPLRGQLWLTVNQSDTSHH